MSTRVFFLNSATSQYGEEELNSIQKFLFSQGILNTLGSSWEDWILNGDLKVKQRVAGANMSVDVLDGWSLLNTTRNAITFKVFCQSIGSTNLTITNNSSGSNRVDAIVMRVSRSATPNLTTSNVATLQVVVGSGVSALTDGAITTALGSDDFIRLANVTVANGAVSILTANIADTRVRASTATAMFKQAPEMLEFKVLATDPSTPNLVKGYVWFNSTTNTLNFYDGTVVKALGNALDTSYFVGFVIPYVGATAPTGWLLCDGQAISRSTYSALFALTGTSYGAGDGSTTFNIPDLRSRTLIGAGTGTKVATFSSRAGNVITVTGLTGAKNNEFQTGQAVFYTTSGTVITGLTNNTTYYLVRVSNTTFSLSTTLANSQNGTLITLSGDGTGTQTFTQTFTARARGDTGGEEDHAMSSTELLDHNHAIIHEYTAGSSQNTYGSTPVTSFTQASLVTGSKGGNVAMNNMQPFAVLNYIVKF